MPEKKNQELNQINNKDEDKRQKMKVFRTIIEQYFICFIKMFTGLHFNLHWILLTSDI